MWFTFLYVVLSIAALDSFAIYFTNYMGTVVYGGNQLSPIESVSYQNYITGVRVGCLSLALGAGVNIPFALSLDCITKFVKLKTVFLLVLTILTIATFVLSVFHQLPLVVVLGISYGPTVGLALTVPFAMIPVYQVSCIYARILVCNALLYLKLMFSYQCTSET